MTPAVVPDQNTSLPAIELKKYSYQPHYPEGHELAGQAMGGEQVIEYDPAIENDLPNKLVANNNRMQAELRNLKRQVTVQHPESDEEEVPATAVRRSARGAAIQARDLTPEELLQFSKGIIDPNRAQAALDMAIEARFGVKPERLAAFDKGISDVRDFIEGNKFRQRHPEVCAVPANRQALLEWCEKRDLDLTCDNYELALTRLKKAGLLSAAPITAQDDPSKSQREPETDPPADSGEASGEPIRRPTSTAATIGALRNNGQRPAGSAEASWAEIERLTAEQMAAKPDAWKKQALLLFRRLPANDLERKMRDRKFKAKLDAL